MVTLTKFYLSVRRVSPSFQHSHSQPRTNNKTYEQNISSMILNACKQKELQIFASSSTPKKPKKQAKNRKRRTAFFFTGGKPYENRIQNFL